MELEAARYYAEAAEQATDAELRQLLGDFAAEERKHEDASVSTLAPLSGSAFATHDSWKAFLVGLAAAVGAGISMGFAEALSDDGSLTGRGHPLPYLIPNFMVATVIATVVVAIELLAIAWIRNRSMDTPFLAAAFQIVVGGVLVFLTGIAIGWA